MNWQPRTSLPLQWCIAEGHQTKLSDQITAVARHIAPGPMPKDAFNAVIHLAVMVWNHPNLTPEQSAEINAELGDDAAFEKTMGFPRATFMKFVKWRQKRFGKDRRLVVDFRIDPSREEAHLQVASIDLDAPKDSGGSWTDAAV